MAEFDSDLVYAVRVMIPDAEPVYGDAGDEYLFEDKAIEAFLTAGKGNAMWAAGLAMIAVGNSEAMIGKVIRNYETETDASKLQREWRSAGNVLIQAGREEVAASEESSFEIAYPDFAGVRHPEGFTHGSYRMFPSSYQW